MTAERVVEPEWLDDLPTADPRAVRSRSDLRLVNRLMGHAGIIRRALARHLQTSSPQIADLGAGDGTLLLRIVQSLGWSGAEIALIDRQPAISAATEHGYRELGCKVTIATADVHEWLARSGAQFDVIIANLFLHHFEPSALARLLAAVAQRTQLFIACEPRRARLTLAGSRMLGLLGCNDVTRHDAVLSVRAGFAGTELSAWWPSRRQWILEERPAGFSHLFVARSA